MLMVGMDPVEIGEEAATILVVEDEEHVARLVQRTLVAFGYQVPAIVTRASEFARALADVDPDLVLLDIDLQEGASGIDLARTIPAQVPFLFLSAHTDSETLVLAGERRPSGFVVKPFTPIQLKAAVDMALASRRAAGDAPPIPLPDLPELAQLSSREREVVEQLLNHRRAPAIAKALFISQHTVRNHLKNIFAKLGVGSQQELLDRITKASGRG
jgi:DNA-binding NarL/FixJ family response regulator